MNPSQNNLLETWNSRITEEGWIAFRAIPSRIIISRGKKPDEINLTRIRTSSSSSSRCRLITLEYNFNTIAAFLRAKQGKLFRYSARNICPPVDSIRSFFPVFFFSSSLDRWKIVWSFFLSQRLFYRRSKTILFIYYYFFLRNYWWLLMIDLYWFSFRHFRLNWFFDQRNVVLRGRGNIYCSRGNELCKLLVRCVQRRQPVFMHLWEV